MGVWFESVLPMLYLAKAWYFPIFWVDVAQRSVNSHTVRCRPLSVQVHSVSPSSAETPAPVSHDTGWWFPLPWRHFLLPASGLVGNLSQGYSPPSLYSPRLGENTAPSDKVPVNTLPHTSPADGFLLHTLLPSTFFMFVEAVAEFLVLYLLFC